MVSLNASLVAIFCYLISYWLPYSVIKCITGRVIYWLTGCHMVSLNASLVAIFCYLLSYWLPYGVIECLTGYLHVVIKCHTGCHIFSLNA